MTANGQTQRDVSARWWFLTPEGFQDFKDDPVAQGYEILSRHPFFPTLLTRTEGGKRVTMWEHGNKHLPRPTWQALDKPARSAFLFRYKFALHRMGLLEIAWLGPAAITFDCTEGVTSILAAAHYWLQAGGLFHSSPEGEYHCRTRTSPGLLQFSPTCPGRPGNPDMVTISWAKLVEKRRGDWLCSYSENAVASLRTFLEHNREYRSYRAQRLRESSSQARSDRPKKPDPAVIALACGAWDCERAGVPFQDKVSNHHVAAIGRSVKGCLRSGDARNHMRRLREMHEHAGFKTQQPPRRKAARPSKAAEPINVVETLYPGFVRPA